MLAHAGARIILTISLVLALGGLLMGVITMLNLVYTSSLLIGIGATLACISLVLLHVTLMLRA